MSNIERLIMVSLCLAPVTLAGNAAAQGSRSIGDLGRTDKPSKKPNPLKNVYFGEQHIHTRNSPDAFAMGNRGTWDDVYRYAMGEEISLSTTGQKVNKNRHPMILKDNAGGRSGTRHCLPMPGKA